MQIPPKARSILIDITRDVTGSVDDRSTQRPTNHRSQFGLRDWLTNLHLLDRAKPGRNLTNCYCCQMRLLKCGKPNRKIRYFHLFRFMHQPRADKSAITGLHGRWLRSFVFARFCTTRPDWTWGKHDGLQYFCSNQVQRPNTSARVCTYGQWSLVTIGTAFSRSTRAARIHYS